MNYCTHCGTSLRRGIPEGDDRPRYICDSCGTIHYQNPKLIAGCIPVWQDRILLCKRAIEPRLGYWTLPAGFMELGETLPDAARREAREEANIEVEIESVYTIFSLPHISQVYVFFRAHMLEERYSAGSETLEARLFREDEIPWNEISFETVYRSLRLFFADRKQGIYTFRMETIAPDPRRMRGD
ncbi:NUDIX hydrolase [Methylocaldum szegediense]|uniref:ADP-ribose/FAD diphosphatase n=1 Tax=Methylocaldum szegediense TaxID=73780 RepID=A0ABN8XDK1_9GAMM|nr:NUDIX hydrolase [Methylocaldum szegediense]CAI8945475.1 ADP-ribose/FAD diphosphatase [Methylocaldum szegediense]